MAMRQIEGLKLHVDRREILPGIGLALAEREIHALLGADGTGKTRSPARSGAQAGTYRAPATSDFPAS